MKHIAIFASGSGSNAQKIAEYFELHPTIQVTFILSNKEDAYVIERAEDLGIKHMTFNRKDFYETERVLDALRDNQIDFVVLAGFLWLFPENIINLYPHSVINIHPALLPKYGGKGMYGMKVHESVVANKEIESGITIHYVNERYDDGDIIFQERCEVTSTDSAEDVAQKIHALEYEHFPQVIERLL